MQIFQLIYKKPFVQRWRNSFWTTSKKLFIQIEQEFKRLARKSAFSIKAKESNIVVVEDFTFDTPNTKSFIAVLKDLGMDNKKSLFVLGDSNKNVYLSSRNLKVTNVVSNLELSTYAILNANNLVLLESSLEGIEENLSK